MEATYAGARRSLHADDIAGIQALYGAPASIPEPSSLAILLGVSAGGLVIRRRRAIASV